MQLRQIGDTRVSAIGLGGMPMSIEGRPDRARSTATIHAALEAGVTLIDTAGAYHIGAEEVGHNESLIAEALASYGGDTSDVLVATKGGHLRPGDGSWTLDGSPEHLREALGASLRRLGVEAIGLFQFHRPDPKVPYEESVGAIRDLLDEGRIRMAGISNANPEQTGRPTRSWTAGSCRCRTGSRPRSAPASPSSNCHEQGIAFLPWSPLGGIRSAAALGDRSQHFAEVAREVDATPQQVALAWMLAKSPMVIPIPGSSRPETIRASGTALDLELTPDQVSRLDRP